ncbi:ProP expression regulator [Kingella potus]|uniref:ProP expression regulator n=1 Tax=Kingella potus TaxID=265175 RepID=A0A377R012_9NEIS|nr:ProQ/FINO family protein [Kingella potus]UOP01287.1 ProQ/FinO family protein [Kingella potus]STR01014.1 ProP expression regulator [Kingella potus]
MTKETALGAALASAVKSMSKTKQTDMITDYIYGKYIVFKHFKPLALGIDQDLAADLPQFDSALVMRALSNHCRRPRYLKSLVRGGKRYDLNNRVKGEVSAEEQAVAAQNPIMKAMLEKQAAAAAQPDAEAAETNPARTQEAEPASDPAAE